MIQRILLAIDASENARRAIPLAAEIAEKCGAEILVLHVREWVMGSGGPLDEGANEAQRLVDPVVDRFIASGVVATAEVRGAYFGHVASRIVEVAESGEADLIVLGSRGVSNLAGILLGDAVHKVLQLARVPVLVAR